MSSGSLATDFKIPSRFSNISSRTFGFDITSFLNKHYYPGSRGHILVIKQISFHINGRCIFADNLSVSFAVFLMSSLMWLRQQRTKQTKRPFLVSGLIYSKILGKRIIVQTYVLPEVFSYSYFGIQVSSIWWLHYPLVPWRALNPASKGKKSMEEPHLLVKIN